MKVISFDSSRATFLFPLEEIIPIGGIDSRSVLEEIAIRYQFAVLPDSEVPREKKASFGRFETGRFFVGDEIVEILDLTIFADGIIANAIKTEYAEAFLVDLIEWLQSDLKFRDHITMPTRVFLSQLVVEFDYPLSRLMPLHEKLCSTLERGAGKIFGSKVPMSLARIEFAFDHIGNKSPHELANFWIERRAGLPFTSERYFSSAQMSSSKHLEVLEMFDSA